MPRSNDRFGCRFSQTAHVPEADPQNNALVVLFECALPVGAQDVNRFHLQPVFLRVLDKDAWGIKSHWLRVQESGCERRQVVAFQIDARPAA